MTGRKHHLQQFGFYNKDLNTIEDPFERDLAFRSRQVVPFCQFCGKEVLDSSQDENGAKVDWQWEMQRRAHYKCFIEFQAEQEEKARLERAKAELEKVKEIEAFDWDKYMKDMLDRKE